MKVHKVTNRKGQAFDVLLDEDFVVDRGIHIVKGKHDKVGYAKVVVNKKDTMLHRIIMNVTDKNIQVDHINGNTLDNRKSNLRLVNASQNCRNRKREGIYYSKKEKHWRATILVDGKNTYIGRSKDKEEAKKMYRLKHEELFGEYSPWRDGK